MPDNQHSPTTSTRVVWLTGASGGLGPGIARMLAQHGYSLALHGNTHTDSLPSLANEVSGQGVRATVTRGDLTDEAGVGATVTQILDDHGRLDAVVHLAGPYVRKTIAEHSRTEFDSMLHGNLTSFFEVCRHCLPHLREVAHGRIVGFGMAGAQHTTPMREHGPHLAAKAGLVALARTLALEEAGTGVTVNVINPGHIVHKSLSRAEARQTPAGPDHPTGVHGSYEDIGAALLYLLSEEASYVTGAVLDISGGWRQPTFD